jgi:hypothetical protein
MLFKEFLLEDGEVSSCDIATVRAPLMKKKVKRKKIKVMEAKDVGKFNYDDVVSKMKNAEKNSELKKNAVVYGIEDTDGNVTKVYISKDQDADFKEALSKVLSDEKNNDVSEILFDLRNTFNILYVEWPELPEDEEVDNVLAKDKKPNDEAAPKEGEEEPEGAEPKEGGAEEIPPVPAEPLSPAPSEDNESILLKVIDMLKADADAKAAEANAKAKEAEAEQAKLTIQLTNTKVKNEEDMLRAEEHFKKQAEKKKEEDRLAKLAKYRNDLIHNTTYESDMKFTDIIDQELINEDVQAQINTVNTQIADLTVRKTRATKVYDDQIRRLQQQLVSLNKQAGAAKPAPAAAPTE